MFPQIEIYLPVLDGFHLFHKISPTKLRSIKLELSGFLDGGANIAKKNSKNNSKSYKRILHLWVMVGWKFRWHVHIISYLWYHVPMQCHFKKQIVFTYSTVSELKSKGLFLVSVCFISLVLFPICSVQKIASNSSLYSPCENSLLSFSDFLGVFRFGAP